MRFRCCPPAKAGASSATPKKRIGGGSALSRTASSGAKRAGGNTGGAKKRDPKRNPLADVDCDDEVEEEIARAFAEGFNLEGPGESPPASPVSEATGAGPPPLSQEPPETLKARTLLILDWDDTLLTTTRLTSRHSVFGPGGASPAPTHRLAATPPFCVDQPMPFARIPHTDARSTKTRPIDLPLNHVCLCVFVAHAAAKPLPATLQRDLALLEEDVLRLLTACQQRGRCVIVTNAAKGWVQQSGKRFVPRVVKHLVDQQISVVSAQAAFAASCPSGDPADWKKKAFLRELTGSNINMVSIGDSIFEREAAHFASKQSRVGTTKTVKFVDSPTIEQLRRQLTTLTGKIDMICLAEHSFDVDMEL